MLGDGSIAGELVAAAQRLLDKIFGPGEFLAHLLTVAAVDLPVEASGEAYQDALWLHLGQAGKTFLPGERRPRAGDLVFLRDPPLVDGDPAFVAAGVVERVHSDTLDVIGEVHGRVQRFVMTSSRPFARRDETTGQIINSPVRRRSLDQGPDVAVTAGALIAGFARP